MDFGYERVCTAEGEGGGAPPADVCAQPERARVQEMIHGCVEEIGPVRQIAVADSW